MVAPWPVPHATQFRSTVPVPGSKSETNRALVIAALAQGPSTVRGGLLSRDSQLMRGALSALGVQIDDLADGRWQITPPARFTPAVEPIDCGLAGTVMRFVPPVAALAEGTTTFIGDDYADQRPMEPILTGLRQLGVEVLDQATSLPFRMTSPQHLPGARIVIDASESSQFVSGFLLAGARYPQGLVVEHLGPEIPSRPHIDMTVAMLREHGVEVAVDGDSWTVTPGPIGESDMVVAPDLTNAAVFLAAAVMARGEVIIPDWPAHTHQAGAEIVEILRGLGADVSTGASRVTALGGRQLQGGHIDLSTASELTPVVAALAAFAEGTTVISGVGHIRGHETDRIHALVENLTRLGVGAQERQDGLEITGAGMNGDGLQPHLWSCFADHRIAHAGALMGLLVPGIELDDVECTTKTLPDFPGMWNSMLAGGV